MLENPTLPDNISITPGINLPEFSIDTLPTGLLVGIFIFALIVVVFTAVILHYHWFKYGFGQKGVIFGQILYTVVTVAAFIIMIGSIANYSA